MRWHERKMAWQPVSVEAWFTLHGEPSRGKPSAGATPRQSEGAPIETSLAAIEPQIMGGVTSGAVIRLDDPNHSEAEIRSGKASGSG